MSNPYGKPDKKVSSVTDRFFAGLELHARLGVAQMTAFFKELINWLELDAPAPLEIQIGGAKPMTK